MPITITIQAPSDAVMTVDNQWHSTALADDDLRKVYGLPNMYVNNKNILKFATYSEGTKPPRWDTINAPSAINNLETVVVSNFDRALGLSEEEMVVFGGHVPAGIRFKAHLPPTTTAFQLRCDSISHDVDDASAISPLPSMSTGAGAKANSMTPGQLINIVIGMGLRSEVIKLTGLLVDEGVISASNPRKQVLMNIARLQYLKSGRGGSEENWGGTNSGPLNPRSYPCLTIYDTNAVTTDTYDRMGVQPAGLDLSYRGIIKNLSFRQEGGRPNQWFWSMEFQVVANEHPQGNFLSSGGAGAMVISRIRLVDSVDEETPLVSADYPSVGRIEIQVDNDLSIPIGHASAGNVRRLAPHQTVRIVGASSVPPVNGHWYIENINYTNNTFLLSEIYNVGGNVTWVDTEDASGRDISMATGINATGEVRGREISGVYKWEGFTNGTDGYVLSPPSVHVGTKGAGSGMKFFELNLADGYTAEDDLN